MTPTNTPRDVALPDKYEMQCIMVLSETLNRAVCDAFAISPFAENYASAMAPALLAARLKLAQPHLFALATAMGYSVTPLDAPGDATPQAHARLARVMGGKDTREDGE